MISGTKKKSLVISITIALISGLVMGGAALAVQNAVTKIEVTPRPFTLGISPDQVDFGVATRGETQNGNDITVSVQSDLDFSISIEGSDIGSIPKANLLYKLDDDSNWESLSATAATLFTGTGSHLEQRRDVNFRLNVPANAPMGTQQGTLTFDASTL